MLWWGGLKNRDDRNICLKTVSGGLRCFLRIDQSGLHQILPKVTCSRPNFTKQQKAEKAEKATKSTKQHETAIKRRRSKRSIGGCNTQARATLTKENCFVTHARTPRLLVVLVAEPIDFAPYVRLHGGMTHGEGDFDEQHSGSSTESSFQLVAVHLRIKLLPRFVQ